VAGSVSVLVLVLVTFAILSVTALSGLSLSMMRMAARGQTKVITLTLAEAGIDYTIFALRSDIAYSGATTAISLYEDPPTNSKRLGTFTTAVTDIDTNTKKILSIGTSNNETRRVVALVNINGMQLGSAAIVSNGPVAITGGATIDATADASGVDLHNADVMANGNISMGGGSSVDGRLFATGTVPGSGSFLSSQGGAPAISFPDFAAKNTMRTNWINQSRATNQIIDDDDISDGMTITAPAYIDGDIDLDNRDDLTLSGSGVIYVNGRVQVGNGATLTNGVTLVVRDNFDVKGAYSVTAGVTPTPTVVAFSTDPDRAIDMNGGGTAAGHGVMYAINGGVTLTGGAEFTGALIAGGTGGVKCAGGYTHHFPSNMASGIYLPGKPTVRSWTEL
jgi:hypothetical protein